jgi:hypothetical protein
MTVFETRIAEGANVTIRTDANAKTQAGPEWAIRNHQRFLRDHRVLHARQRRALGIHDEGMDRRSDRNKRLFNARNGLPPPPDPGLENL